MKRWSQVHRAAFALSVAALAVATGGTVALAAPFHKVNGPESYVTAGQEMTVTATCPSGEVPTGGGGYSTSVLFTVSRSFAIDTTWYWSGRYSPGATESAKVSAFVICTTP
ncbi:hypothetical protein AB0M92_20100 [Streptomyces sp. NPDC051582]|uniref:hypothetical protein n=1 Tax=Streptomyces sp. NPDC051582 TaxID=3155167 RepID=UPI0034385B85